MSKTSRQPRPKPLRSENAPLEAAAPWYAEGLCFSCTQCGNCCSGAPGYVWVSPAELTAMARFLKMAPEEFARRHARRVGKRLSLLELAGGDCEFLERLAEGKTTCRIHRVRPGQCRTWPFWKSNVRSRRAWGLAARDCPGLDSGRRHRLPVIQGALQANGDAELPL